MTDKAEGRRLLLTSTTEMQFGVGKSRKTMHFYQKGQLTMKIADQGNLHVLRAQNTPVALLDQTLSAVFLNVDEVHTILGMPPNSMGYSPYGHLGVDNPTILLGFTGQLYDPLTQGYLLGNGHRLFKTSLMRFCSPDTFSPFDTGGMNAYAYCLNDPVNKVDPSGKTPGPVRKPVLQSEPLYTPRDLFKTIIEPDVRTKIFNQLPAADLGRLASTSRTLHSEIGELSRTNAIKLSKRSTRRAVYGEVNGVMPIDIPVDVRHNIRLKESTLKQIKSLPIINLEKRSDDYGVHPGAMYLNIKRSSQETNNFYIRNGTAEIDPVTGRRNALLIRN